MKNSKSNETGIKQGANMSIGHILSVLFFSNIVNIAQIFQIKQQTFCHFIKKPIILQHTFSYLYCPISTCNHLGTVINIYNNINKNKSISIELDRAHDGIACHNYFNWHPLSDFANQGELVLVGCLFQGKSIINVKW